MRFPRFVTGVAGLVLAAAGIAHGQTPPLGLMDAVGAALEQSSAVQRRQAELGKAAAVLREANARFLPLVEIQGSASYLTNPPEGITINRGQFGVAPSANSPTPAPLPPEDYVLVPDTESTYFKLTTTLTQPIFTWGKLRAAQRVAQGGQAIAVDDLRAAREETVRSVRQAWWGAVLGRDSAAALREAEVLLASAVEDTERSLEAGDAVVENVLDARARLARVRSQRVQAEEAEASARASLAWLMGRETVEGDLRAEWSRAPSALDAGEIARKALASSTGLANLDRRLRQAAEAVKIQEATGPFRPDLALSVTLDITGQRVPFLDANWIDTWDAGLVISIGAKTSVLDFGRASARTESARSDQRLAEAGRDEMARGLRVQAQVVVESLRNAQAAVEEKEIALELATERARGAQIAFENDLASRADAQGAQVLAIGARIELLLARYQRETALAEMDYLQGTGVAAP